MQSYYRVLSYYKDGRNHVCTMVRVSGRTTKCSAITRMARVHMEYQVVAKSKSNKAVFVQCYQLLCFVMF